MSKHLLSTALLLLAFLTLGCKPTPAPTGVKGGTFQQMDATGVGAGASVTTDQLNKPEAPRPAGPPAGKPILEQHSPRPDVSPEAKQGPIEPPLENTENQLTRAKARYTTVV